jgi:hypothetical protein
MTTARQMDRPPGNWNVDLINFRRLPGIQNAQSFASRSTPRSRSAQTLAKEIYSRIMETCRSMASHISAFDIGEWSASRSSRLIAEEGTPGTQWIEAG